MTNDNADVADFLLEVSAVDSGDLTTDSLSPPSFRITISPFPVVLVAPNDLYDLVYVLRDPTKTTDFQLFLHSLPGAYEHNLLSFDCFSFSFCTYFYRLELVLYDSGPLNSMLT